MKRPKLIKMNQPEQQELQPSSPTRHPAAETAHPLIQLQRTIGNRALSRLVQAKLKTGQPQKTVEHQVDQPTQNDTIMRKPVGNPASLPVPGWKELPAYAQSDLAPAGYGEGWFNKQTDAVRLTVLNLYVKLKGINLWQYVEREAWTDTGTMQFKTNVPSLKTELRQRENFTDPEESDKEWSSREMRSVGQLHFKHFPSFDDNVVQAHMDKYGLFLKSPLWWLLPVVPPGQMLAHLFTYSSYKDVLELRDILLGQGWDPAPLVGVAAPPVQKKLAISQPGDAYEQEADRIADQVMQMPSALTQERIAERHPASAQRMPGEGLQPEATPASGMRSLDFKTSGQPLPAPLRAYFEPRFQYDFSQVCVHTGAEAAESAKALQARAYTVGDDVVFGSNEYDPSSGRGLHLMAHELVHVAQQRHGRGVETPSAEGGSRIDGDTVLSPKMIGSAPYGIYPAPFEGTGFSGTTAQTGWQPSPGRFGYQPPSVTLSLPPLKISQELLIYLLNNNLLTPEMREMLLRGEIVIGEAEPTNAPKGTAGEDQKTSRIMPELDWLRMHVGERKSQEAAATPSKEPDKVYHRGFTDPMLAYVPGDYGPKPPDAIPSPYVKKEKSDWYKFSWTKGLDLLKLPLTPNIFLTGVTFQLLHKGHLGVETKVGWTASVDVHISYKNAHLLVSIDRFGNWEVHLSGPTNYPTPTIARLKDIFTQGEVAIETIARTVKAGPPNPSQLGAVKDRFATLADPLKYAIDAAQGIANAPGAAGAPQPPGFEKPRETAELKPEMSWSIVAGAGPGPGKLPEDIPKGIPPSSDVKPGFYGGFNFTVTF